MRKPVSISFLFGAGLSCAGGYPSTTALTGQVLSGQGVFRHTDSTYYIGSEPHNYLIEAGEYRRPITSFLARIKTHVDQYYGCFGRCDDRTANYEDLSYIAAQIYGCESGEWDNAAVKPLVDSLEHSADPILDLGPFESILELSSEAHDYIADVVWRRLTMQPISTRHLGFVESALADSATKVEGISTLNHDVHLEGHLRQAGVAINDGFGDPDSGVRYWQHELSLCNNMAIPFLKLHGSINWFRFRPDGAVHWWGDKVGIPCDGDHWHTKFGDTLQLPIDGRPLFLIGTFNKMYEYSAGVFGELHAAFRQVLRRSRRIVIAGYGFGDKGINAAVLEWLYSSNDRVLICIHPDPEQAKNRARGAIRNKWDELREKGILRVLPRMVEDVDWASLRDIIGR